MATVVVPREYGYVVLVAVGSTFMLVWKGVMVSVVFHYFSKSTTVS